MQNWAGAGWGFQFIPRIGMEVLVLFLGGDVDKPMVIGCTPNGEHPSPFALPANKTISGVRSHSTPQSDGYNELSFEDIAGHERVHLRAQRNLDEHVLNDHITKVDNSQRIQIARKLRSGGTGDLEIRTKRRDEIIKNRNNARGQLPRS